MAITAMQTPSSAFLKSPMSTTHASASVSSSSSGSGDLQSIIEEFESYPFSDDADFKAGLPTVIAAIRGTKRSAIQIDEMIARAQWFFFCRLKGISIPFEAYAAAHLKMEGLVPHSPTAGSRSRSPTPQSQPGSPNASRRQDPLTVLNTLAEAKRMMSMMGSPQQSEEGMSFAMLCKLISEGRANEVVTKQIPDTLNDAAPSPATMLMRPKPWEMPPTTFPAPPFTHSSPSSSTALPSTLAPHAPLEPPLAPFSEPPAGAYSALNFAPYGLNSTMAPSPHFTVDSPMSPATLTPFNLASFNFASPGATDQTQEQGQ